MTTDTRRSITAKTSSSSSLQLLLLGFLITTCCVMSTDAFSTATQRRRFTKNPLSYEPTTSSSQLFCTAVYNGNDYSGNNYFFFPIPAKEFAMDSLLFIDGLSMAQKGSSSRQTSRFSTLLHSYHEEKAHGNAKQENAVSMTLLPREGSSARQVSRLSNFLHSYWEEAHGTTKQENISCIKSFCQMTNDQASTKKAKKVKAT